MAQQYMKGKKTEEVRNDYKGFVEKFKPKRTTDDCYTPDYIYDTVAEYVEQTYHIDRARFVRPFYPGGDYEHFDYGSGVVVDNPPFSILSKIIKFYQERGIPFFLFAPALTTFSSSSSSASACLCVGFPMIYENGANVPTSFITSLESCRCRTAPELYFALDNATRAHRQETKAELPRYKYPDNVITAAMLNDYSKNGIHLIIEKKDSIRIGRLDAQKKYKKAIFGSGYLLSDRARVEAKRARVEAEQARVEAERARVEAERAKPRIVWQLSTKELEIIRKMDGTA